MATADVIVIGLGAMGGATTAALAARGASVIGIDRYAPPHAWGSTHGETRITRLAIGEGREYVPLVRRSHALWRALEQETDTALLSQVGIVILARPQSAFLTETIAAAEAYGIAHERLDTDELRARHPMFAVPDGTAGYYEPEAGFVRPEAALSAQLGLARRHGAVVRLGERVTGWSASADGVRVTTDQGEHAAGQLVICAGAWLPELVPAARELVAVYRQLLFWFPIAKPERYAQLREMPTFVWERGGDAAGFVHLNGFYGFPAIDGPDGGVKLAMETYERTTRPDGRQHPATESETAAIVAGCVAPCLPWLGRAPLRTVSCLYTCIRDGRFVIDRHPAHENVMVVSACSGHGFKHSAAIGEAVAAWACGDEPGVDLSPFRFPAS